MRATVAILIVLAAGATVAFLKLRHPSEPHTAVTANIPPAPSVSAADFPRPSHHVVAQAAASISQDTQVRDANAQYLASLKGARDETIALGAFAHVQQIVNSPDDPVWARPMEAQLLGYIQQQREAGGLEIKPIVCRAAGCEIVVLASLNSSPLDANGELAGWNGILQRFRGSPLQDRVGRPIVLTTQMGDRVVFITTFERKQAENSTAPTTGAQN